MTQRFDGDPTRATAPDDERQRGLRIHATVTAAVSVLLVIINIATPTAFPWAIFPVAGMGVGLAVHWHFARAFPTGPPG